MTVIQRTPNLGIGIRLQREQVPADSGAAKAPELSGGGCGCQANGVMWQAGRAYEADNDEWYWPNTSQHEVLGINEYGSLDIDWDTRREADFMAVWAPSETQPAVTVVAAAVGPQTRGIEWRYQREAHASQPDAPSFGIDIDAQSQAVITIHPYASGGGFSAYETLTLTAYCNNQAVGTLILQVYVDAW